MASSIVEAVLPASPWARTHNNLHRTAHAKSKANHETSILSSSSSAATCLEFRDRWRKAAASGATNDCPTASGNPSRKAIRGAASESPAPCLATDIPSKASADSSKSPSSNLSDAERTSNSPWRSFSPISSCIWKKSPAMNVSTMAENSKLSIRAGRDDNAASFIALSWTKTSAFSWMVIPSCRILTNHSFSWTNPASIFFFDSAYSSSIPFAHKLGHPSPMITHAKASVLRSTHFVCFMISLLLLHSETIPAVAQGFRGWRHPPRSSRATSPPATSPWSRLH